jgi:hypothetical protein
MFETISKQTLFISILAIGIQASGCGKDETKPSPADQTDKAAATEKPATTKTEGTAKNAGTEQLEAVALDETTTKPLDDETFAKLTGDASIVIEAIVEARTELQAKKKAKAKKALQKASTALDRIVAERPTTSIAATLLTSKRELDLPEIAESVETIPIFASLDRIEQHVASPKAISERKTERQGDKDGVSVEEKQADLAMIDANLIYTEVDMPIASTRVHILAAQRLVDEGKLKDADEMLEQAQASLEVIEEVHEAPEFEARQLVWDAEAAFTRGKTDEAKVLLAAAKDVLDPLAKGDDVDPETKKVATSLIAEITPLQDVLEPGNEKHGAALNALQRSVWGFAQRAVARAVLAGRRSEERFALADALWYLEKAQTDGLYKGNEDADGSLLMASAMLGMAKKKANVSTTPVIEDLENRVKQLVDLNEARADAKDKDKADDAKAVDIELLHQALKFDLRTLMFDLQLPPEPDTLARATK